MPILSPVPPSRFRWSPDAAHLDLPDSIKSSIAVILHKDVEDDASRTAELTIRDAWQVTAKYALTKVNNGSRDSDLLASHTVARARLSLPALELLIAFPHARLSDVKAEQTVVNMLRQSCIRTLTEVDASCSRGSDVSDVELVRGHDLRCLEASEEIVDSLSKVEKPCSEPLLSSLTHYLVGDDVPPLFRHTSAHREILWRKIYGMKTP